jgi:hypothetical protein
MTIAFLAAVGGVAIAGASRRRSALLLALPYVNVRRRDLRNPGGARTMVERVAVDAAIATSMLRASARERTLLL